MGVASKAGDWAFKAFTAGLGVATIYLAATFSVNVYRGLSWLATQNSFGGLVMSAMGKESEESLHLIPSTNLVVNLFPAQDMKQAHGIHQWWRPDLNLQSKPAKPGTPISKFILSRTKLSFHEAVHNILYKHEGELAAAASQPLPDDDDDAFD
ncbi:unnamed protein product [Camellia sinensis]